MVRYTWCRDCSAGKRIIHIDWDSWVYFSVIPIPQSVNSSISGPLYVVISLLLVSSIGEEELNVQRDRVRWCGDIKITDCATSQPDTTADRRTTWRLGEEKNSLDEQFAPRDSQSDGDRRDRWFMISSFCLAF